MIKTVEVTVNDIPVEVTICYESYGEDVDGNRGTMRWHLEEVTPLDEDNDWNEHWNDEAFEKALDRVSGAE